MTNLSRRSFAVSLAALPTAATIGAIAGAQLSSPAIGKDADSTGSKARPPLATLNVGRFEVTALTDGYTDMPHSFFTGRPEATIADFASRGFPSRETGLRLAFNQFLIRDGDTRVLIDTGPASTFGTTGQLPTALAALGLTPDDINAVILTHMHMDHISGLVAGREKVFKTAEVFVDRRDVAFWSDAGRRSSAPAYLESSFAASADVVRLYPDLNAVDGEREIIAGVTLVDLAGHTPGHIGVRIADGTESLIMTSDMLFHPTVHPRAADIGFVFEQDPAAAQRMRERFFPMAADEGALIAATHMPFPGLGRIVRDGGELRWVAADWAHGG